MIELSNNCMDRKDRLRQTGSIAKSRVVFTGDSAGSNPRLWAVDGQTGSYIERQTTEIDLGGRR
jgi:hypothetical protein